MDTVFAFLFGIALAYGYYVWNKRQKIKRIQRLVLLELELPLEPPAECPKCGNDRFHSPYHWTRQPLTDRPEHLAYNCWKCSGTTMVRVRH